jgi:hypothetical protein
LKKFSNQYLRRGVNVYLEDSKLDIVGEAEVFNAAAAEALAADLARRRALDEVDGRLVGVQDVEGSTAEPYALLN